ncbi:helix-turn-helix transcriptional regulator [Actinomadura sp. 9N407]|uniref:helix-turn-helix transcriptional regulator n=1 Tax=Actinomadura sp. 9N407 TaxID=3375154 RepID=UPI003792541D
MPSPYVRRRRLAIELRKIRENRGLTIEELAKLVFQSRTKITRLELGQVRPDLAEIVKILHTLGVEGRQYDKMFQLALDAAEKGWWDRYSMAIGPRQKLYADIESGADSIRSFDQTAMPAVLQSPEFVEALVDLDRSRGALDYRPDRMADARARRQKCLLRPNGPSYETVLDECIIGRLAVPTAAMAAQLRHLVSVVTNEDRIVVRLLRHNSKIPGGFLPRASFYLFTFPDQADPPMAVLDTVTTDLVMTERREVEEYTELFDRLRNAALSPEDSLAFLDRVAADLTEEAVSGA